MKRYITGFDGLRTLGVLGVIFYHLYPTDLKGGYLGVVLFFVLSGYLVTDLLLQEYEERGKVRLIGFYKRRFKRLYPSLLIVFIASSLYMFFFQSDMLNQLRMTVVSSLLSFNNWWQIWGGNSYFTRLLSVAPFSHLYSLAIEAQFYLIWPIFLVILMKIVPSRLIRLVVVLGLTVASAVLMAILFKVDQDPTRVYYGTDTRLFSPLLGGALALIWPSSRLHRLNIPKIWQQRCHLIFGGLLFVYFLLHLYLPDQHWLTYRFGLLFVSLLCVVIVALVVMPQLRVNAWLTNPLFTYLGKRSYEIYLWQTPLFAFVQAKLSHPHRFWPSVFQIGLILVLSELTYQLVRRKAQLFRFQTIIRQIKVLGSQKAGRLRRWRAGMFIGLLVGVTCIILLAPDRREEQKLLAQSIEKNQELMAKAKKKIVAETDLSDEELKRLAQKYDVKTSQLTKVHQLPVLAFGDSMFTKTYPHLIEVFPKLIIEAEFGQVPEQMYDTIEMTVATHPESEQVILALGTNPGEQGTLNAEVIDNIMTRLKGKDVYWININLVNTSYWWTVEVNEVLAEAEQTYDNLSVIDWYGPSQEHASEWFEIDGFHPNELGSLHYTRLILLALLAD